MNNQSFSAILIHVQNRTLSGRNCTFRWLRDYTLFELFHRVDFAGLLFALPIASLELTAECASPECSHTMRPARDSACVTASDSAEAQTETKLHNVTNAHREANRRELRVCVLTCVRVEGGMRNWKNWQRRRKRGARKRKRVEKKRRGNDGRAPVYPPRANQFRERRACVWARVCGQTWMCAEKRILPSSVERTRASSCQRTPPRNPLWNQPLPSWRNPSLLRVAGSFPLTSHFSIPFRTALRLRQRREAVCLARESESNRITTCGRIVLTKLLQWK